MICIYKSLQRDLRKILKTKVYLQDVGFIIQILLTQFRDSLLHTYVRFKKI